MQIITTQKAGAVFPGLIFHPALLLCFALLACTPRISEPSVAVPVPEMYSISGTADFQNRWWLAFDDPGLHAAIERALLQNFDLKAIQQRIAAAQAAVHIRSAQKVPAVDISGSGGISRTQLDFQESQRFQVELEADYQVDLWGRIGALVDAERFRLEAERANFQRGQIVLSSLIASNWFALASTQQQLDVIDAQIRVNEQILQLITNRFGTGQIRSVDILRQRQLLESTREQRVYVEVDKQLLLHQLAILQGLPPTDSISMLPAVFPALPALPDAGVPLTLLQRRPDVQRIYSLVQAADRELAAAISNQYPRLSLSASAASLASNVGNLFKGWTLSLAGNLLVPVFYGGQLRAEVDRARAVKEELLLVYGQISLEAYREVEDALVQEQKQQAIISRIEAQLELATQAYEQLQLEYFSGLNNYLDVLTAIQQEQQIRRRSISARRDLLLFRVDLYTAIAGAFENASQN